MPATMSTKVWPIATTSSGIMALSMSSSVSAVAISGTTVAMAPK